MPFIVPGGASDVTSVNDMTGQVILTHKDLGAVANILDSCGGIQVGATNQRPSSARDNVLFVVTDTTPNRFYRYSVDTGRWETIGGTEGGGSTPTDVIAIDVSFNNSGTVLESSNLQNVIIELNNLINEQGLSLTDKIDKSEGKVKLDINDNAKYLEDKIDGVTLQIENGRVVVKSIQGLESSVEELNYLKNARENIQGQIDSLENIGNFTEAVDTQPELSGIANPENNDMAIVIEDEAKNGKSTIYMYDGLSWVFVGEFKAELRDFETNPLRLAQEVTGILSEVNIDDKIARKSDLVELMKTTDEVEEGENNLYYTDNRVNAHPDVSSNTEARHIHDNKETLDKLGENSEGQLLFNNELIEGGGEGSINWVEF